VCDAQETKDHSDTADQQQSFASETVDEGHGEDGGDEVHQPDSYRLKVSGNLGVASLLEDVIRVVEDDVDSGRLVEESDADGEEDRDSIFPLEERFGLRALAKVDGFGDLLQLLLDVFFASHGEYGAGFGYGSASDEPARAARDSEKREKE